MANYSYSGKHEPPTIGYKKPTPDDPKPRPPRFGDRFCDPNTSGSAVEQLEAEYYKTVDHRPGTLVVLVGHFPEKMPRLLDLYKNSVNLDSHDCFVAYNGEGSKKFRKHLPKNCIADLKIVDNYGWDLRMYAEAVMTYAYDRYFFINDDTYRIRRGWFESFEEKIQECDLVGVQGVPFIRTSYYGCRRLLWLAIYLAVKSDMIKYDWRRVRRFMRNREARHHVLHKLGAHYAYQFEGANSWLCKLLGFKQGYIDDPLAMRDRYCRRTKYCTRQHPVGSREVIRNVEGGIDNPMTIDYIISKAKQSS